MKILFLCSCILVFTLAHAESSSSGSASSSAAEIEVDPKKKKEIEEVRKDWLFLSRDELDKEIAKEKRLEKKNKVRKPAPVAITPWTIPGTSITTPTAYGVQWGQGFVGLAAQHRSRFTNNPDGIFFLGIGFGNTTELVALEVSLTLTDLDPFWEFSRGGIGFKLHHFFENGFAVAVGKENAIHWGPDDAGSSLYAVVSKEFFLKEDQTAYFSSLTAHFGVGNERFQTVASIRDGRNTIGFFGALALRASEPISAIVNWTGQDLYAGLSVAPFRTFPIIINGAVGDTLGIAGDGPRYILAAVWGDTIF